LTQFADPAALHQERAPFAAEPGAGEQRHAFLLGGQHDRAHRRIGMGQLDQPRMPGIRHVGELAYAELPKRAVDRVPPVRRTGHRWGENRVRTGRPSTMRHRSRTMWRQAFIG
jgi:hypothetical protein